MLEKYVKEEREWESTHEYDHFWKIWDYIVLFASMVALVAPHGAPLAVPL